MNNYININSKKLKVSKPKIKPNLQPLEIDQYTNEVSRGIILEEKHSDLFHIQKQKHFFCS